jgi:ActR/RegA family two-component response regulator
MSDTNFLIIDDDEVFAGILARGLARRGYTTHQAHDADEALKLANQHKFGQITVDLHLGDDSGLRLVSPLRDLQPDARILVLTGYASIATAVQAVKDGADNYLAKPANVETIRAAGVGAHSACARRKQREHFSDGARAEHASAHLAAQAGEKAGASVRIQRDDSF